MYDAKKEGDYLKGYKLTNLGKIVVTVVVVLFALFPVTFIYISARTTGETNIHNNGLSGEHAVQHPNGENGLGLNAVGDNADENQNNGALEDVFFDSDESRLSFYLTPATLGMLRNEESPIFDEFLDSPENIAENIIVVEAPQTEDPGLPNRIFSEISAALITRGVSPERIYYTINPEAPNDYRYMVVLFFTEAARQEEYIDIAGFDDDLDLGADEQDDDDAEEADDYDPYLNGDDAGEPDNGDDTANGNNAASQNVNNTANQNVNNTAGQSGADTTEPDEDDTAYLNGDDEDEPNGDAEEPNGYDDLYLNGDDYIDYVYAQDDESVYLNDDDADEQDDDDLVYLNGDVTPTPIPAPAPEPHVTDPSAQK